jgi:predicted AlkP superfamily phosphohydrolase/phosphomutase
MSTNRSIVVTICALVIAILVALPAPAPAEEYPPVVVVGIDGMDPILLQQFVDKGVMPNFEKLIATGSFSPLGTSIPPQSPVAWSNFITGMDPGGHGIFDFIHRDPATYLPKFSTALVTEPSKVLSLGDWVIPINHGETKLLRKGDAFWQLLEPTGVPYNIFRVPANFPPTNSKDRTLSGMGTPDIIGSYGTFSFYTNDDIYEDRDVSGGEIYMVEVEDNSVTAYLHGPENSLRRDRPLLRSEFTIDIDPENDAAKFTVGDEAFIVTPGEWSSWVPVHFDVLGPLKGISGITRFYVRSLRPYLEVYATPININPADPALPISTPPDYAKDIFEKIGYYYTQGMPEDTKALEYGMLDDAEFVSQTDNVLDERWKMLRVVLDDYRGGFLFFYVSSIDQCCHALWRNVDEHHPAHTDGMKFGDHFEYLYRQMDDMLGVVTERIPEEATLIVMSDHGFAPYYYKFHLNTWLYQNGYLNLVRVNELGKHPLLGNVFWRRTKAYALGINGMYVNMLGRESKGIVRKGEQYEQLLDEISEKLLAVRDPNTGEQVITRVYRKSDIYHGPEAQDGPDLVIGYNRGYRGSDESAMGTLTEQIITPNLGKWTGDHCMDHTKVPGIILCNRPIILDDPDLKDLPPTILRLYGVEAPAQMKGRLLLDPDNGRSTHVRR